MSWDLKRPCRVATPGAAPDVEAFELRWQVHHRGNALRSRTGHTKYTGIRYWHTELANPNDGVCMRVRKLVPTCPERRHQGLQVFQVMTSCSTELLRQKGQGGACESFSVEESRAMYTVREGNRRRVDALLGYTGPQIMDEVMHMEANVSRFWEHTHSEGRQRPHLLMVQSNIKNLRPWTG
eukprot:1160449-Pelagomonas_calceolata.AAC.11